MIPSVVDEKWSKLDVTVSPVGVPHLEKVATNHVVLVHPVEDHREVANDRAVACVSVAFSLPECVVRRAKAVARQWWVSEPSTLSKKRRSA